MKRWLVLFVLMGMVSCGSEQTPREVPPHEQVSRAPAIELRHDLSASDFKTALIGKWESAFTYKAKRNVQTAQFKPDGTVTLVIESNGETKRYSGRYTVSFDKEPAPRSTTFATITIKPDNFEPIVLSRVNFDLHNGVPYQWGPILRIDTEPYGALRRIN